jgi:hypothetical protein
MVAWCERLPRAFTRHLTGGSRVIVHRPRTKRLTDLAATLKSAACSRRHPAAPLMRWTCVNSTSKLCAIGCGGAAEPGLAKSTLAQRSAAVRNFTRWLLARAAPRRMLRRMKAHPTSTFRVC